jgi:hypothetical protein
VAESPRAIRKLYRLSRPRQRILCGWYQGREITVAEWSTERICGCSLAETVGLSTAEGMVSASCDCSVLSGRGLCVGLIPTPEETYRLW